MINANYIYQTFIDVFDEQFFLIEGNPWNLSCFLFIVNARAILQITNIRRL
jgi:hypothetical protein